MEDYIELVETDILKGNKQLIELCKEIRRKHADALRILSEYSDNAEAAVGLCVDELSARSDVHVYKSGKRSCSFYTDAMAAFFARRGESIELGEGTVKLDASIRCADGPLTAVLCLFGAGDSWSDAQRDIMSAFEPDKRAGGKYFALGVKKQLLSEIERYSSDDFASRLHVRLGEFLQALDAFDKRLEGM